VLVEFALAAPILVLLMLGVLEYGNAWRESLNLASAVRSAVRQDSNTGQGRSADYLALQSFNAVMANSKGTTIQKIVVFRTTSANGGPLDPTCFTVASPAASANCSVYTGAQLASLGSTYLTHFGPTDSSCTGAWDANWCPLVRKDLQSDPPDYVGVWVKATYRPVSGLLPTTTTLTDQAVMRIEPRVS
jgi:Flp pilus assembly protein TadG